MGIGIGCPMSVENSNLISLAVGAVVAGGVALLFTSSSRNIENQSDSIYQLPAVISRVEANEERINNVRRDITIINDKLYQSPTTNEVAVEVDALRRRLEDVLNEIDAVEIELARVGKESAGTVTRLEERTSKKE